MEKSSGLTNGYPTNIYLFKVSDKNTRKKCDIC